MKKNKSIQADYRVVKNVLLYSPDEESHPAKIKGKWFLDKKHNLQLVVDKSLSKRFGKTISFQTRVESVSKNKITFELLERNTPLGLNVKRITLNGDWFLNKENKLSFRVKTDQKHCEIVFSNKFEITKNNEIIYLYSRDTKERTVVSSFLLKGNWRLEKDVLSYAVEGSKNSTLDFKVSFKKNIKLYDQKIVFIVKAQKRESLKISLTGRWYICRGLKAEFTLNNNRGKISFIVTRSINNKKLVLKLYGDKKNLGVDLIIEKKIKGNLISFLKLKLAKEKRLDLGAIFVF